MRCTAMRYTPMRCRPKMHVHKIYAHADGTPRMFFVCAHETGQFLNRYALYLGASQSDWGAFNAIKSIRRADRNRKMRNYTHRAWQAFTELQRIENGINLPPNVTEYRPYRIRLSAIQLMRGSPYQ
jgi:hypothetical protein